MATSFEKVMQACLESKKVNNKTATNKKAPAKKVVESKTSVKKNRKFYEEEEAPEIDEIPEDPEVDDVMDDTADDIMVVVDPEIDAEDIDTVAAELQDIVDDTPEGEIPATDEYVDDYTYACPICGSTFFSETELQDGDECPVCGETPDAFVLVGQVAPTEDVIEGEEVDEVEDTEEVPDEDLEPAVPEEELKVVDDEEVPAEESKKRARFTGYQLDESTFNPFLTKFIRENYKNAKSFTMRKATYNRGTKALKIECVVTMKSGAKKNATLTVENFNPSKNVMLAKDTSRTFKCEGKVAPFRFAINRVGRTLKCEGLKYNYTTKAMKEGARIQVSGSLIKESKKNPTRGRRVK